MPQATKRKSKSRTNDHKLFVQHVIKEFLELPQKGYMDELNKYALKYGA